MTTVHKSEIRRFAYQAGQENRQAASKARLRARRQRKPQMRDEVLLEAKYFDEEADGWFAISTGRADPQPAIDAIAAIAGAAR